MGRRTEPEEIKQISQVKTIKQTEKGGNNKKRPEILAPAGDMAGVIAAINAGADAVYFGGRICNARQRAHNFDDDAMRHAIRLCHQHGVRAYLTVNTLIKDEEWPEMAAYCEMLSHSTIDGLIVQDPGLIWYLRKNYPDLSLQTSTQASVGGLPSVLFFESLGFDRVVLPREMPIEEVRDIRHQTSVELKVFAHGALCYCRSGQCLMSSFIGARSGNRGLCAQPCRKTYTLYTKNGRKIKSGYLLSMKDLNTANHAQDLVDAGVNALKIEGRLRNTAYIYVVTKYYREAFDALDNPNVVRSFDKQDLDAVFSRDFTPGWLFKKQGHINETVQKKRGERIGTIKSVHRHEIVLSLDRGVTLHIGDGLAFGQDARVGLQVDAMKKMSNGLITLPTRLSGQAVHPGDVVFRNKHAALLAEVSSAAEKPVAFTLLPVDLTLTLRHDVPVTFSWYCDGRTGHGKAAIPQKAQKHALTRQLITEQLSKLGGTDFILRQCDITLDDGLFLSKKELNELRRQIVDAINGIPFKKQFNFPKRLYQRNVAPVVSVQLTHFRKIDDYKKYAALTPDEWVIPWETAADNDAIAKVVDDIHKRGARVKIALPEILNTEKSRTLMENRAFLDGLEPDGYVARNYETLYLFSDGKVPLEAGANLQLFNSLSVKAFSDWGCSSGVISKELGAADIISMLGHTTMPLVLTVYGRQEVMLSDNCVIGCNEKRCMHCPHAGSYDLKDKSGARFPLILGKDGLTRIYNADILCLTHKSLKRLSGVAVYRLEATDESVEDLAVLIAGYRDGGRIDIQRFGAGVRLTVGNFNRGVE